MNEERNTAGFKSNRWEVLAALVSYWVGWIYIDAITGIFDGEYRDLIVFAAVFSIGAMLLNRRQLWKRKEHWIWLACLWLCIVCQSGGRNRVWGYNNMILFIHCYAIYWIVCLSGQQIDCGSSAWLVMDAINGVLVYPFKHMFTFLRTRVLIWGVRQIGAGREKRYTGVGYGFAAAVVAGFLFVGAGQLLGSADSNFGTFLNGLLPKPDMGDLGWYIARFIFIAMPVGAYLYGLVVGTGREDRHLPDGQREELGKLAKSLSRVPNQVWTVLTACFVGLYLLFLGFQSSYLFGAFFRALPEGFTVAQYARQGFFEICKIVGLNFCLLWLVCFSSRQTVREDKALRIVCTVLLSESILFAVTAISKLVLYIDCFGFTPLRLQSFWGVTVLAAGCVCSMVSLWTGKKTAKIWIFFTGISLALLHLY